MEYVIYKTYLASTVFLASAESTETSNYIADLLQTKYTLCLALGGHL